MPLKDAHIVVTGGAGGIGSLLCKSLMAEGAEITVIDRVDALDFGARLFRGNLGTVEGITELSQKLAVEHVDMLINLAGIQYFGPLDQQPPENIALTYTINLLAPVLFTHALLPQMKARKSGHIVNIGSTFGSIPFAHFVTYSSSKAGMKGFSEALRREVVAEGIHVTHISPRAVKTKLNNEKVLKFAELTKMNMDAPEEVAHRILQAIKKQEKNVFIGFPESLFVRVNALLPNVVDNALSKNDQLAANLFKS